MEGYLSLKLRYQTQKVWVVLDGQQINYYKELDEGEQIPVGLKGAMIIKDATINKFNAKDVTNGLSITSQAQNKKVNFVCDTASTCSSWFNALVRACKLHQEEIERIQSPMLYRNILEIDVNQKLSKQSIAKAYKKLCLKEHPDKGGNPDTFNKINTAYNHLMNLQTETDLIENSATIYFEAVIEKCPGIGLGLIVTEDKIRRRIVVQRMEDEAKIIGLSEEADGEIHEGDALIGINKDDTSMWLISRVRARLGPDRISIGSSVNLTFERRIPNNKSTSFIKVENESSPFNSNLTSMKMPSVPSKHTTQVHHFESIRPKSHPTSHHMDEPAQAKQGEYDRSSDHQQERPHQTKSLPIDLSKLIMETPSRPIQQPSKQMKPDDYVMESPSSTVSFVTRPNSTKPLTDEIESSDRPNTMATHQKVIHDEEADVRRHLQPIEKSSADRIEDGRFMDKIEVGHPSFMGSAVLTDKYSVDKVTERQSFVGMMEEKPPVHMMDNSSNGEMKLEPSIDKMGGSSDRMQLPSIDKMEEKRLVDNIYDHPSIDIMNKSSVEIVEGNPLTGRMGDKLSLPLNSQQGDPVMASNKDHSDVPMNGDGELDTHTASSDPPAVIADRGTSNQIMEGMTEHDKVQLITKENKNKKGTKKDKSRMDGTKPSATERSQEVSQHKQKEDSIVSEKVKIIEALQMELKKSLKRERSLNEKNRNLEQKIVNLDSFITNAIEQLMPILNANPEMPQTLLQDRVNKPPAAEDIKYRTEIQVRILEMFFLMKQQLQVNS